MVIIRIDKFGRILLDVGFYNLKKLKLQLRNRSTHKAYIVRCGTGMRLRSDGPGLDVINGHPRRDTAWQQGTLVENNDGVRTCERTTLLVLVATGGSVTKHEVP